jgi:hypothetical protein
MRKTIFAVAAAAVVVVLAIVLLAIAGLSASKTRRYHRLQKNDFGLPAEIAEQVKVRCAEIFPFYDTQMTCIEDDARAYKKLHGED